MGRVEDSARSRYTGNGLRFTEAQLHRRQQRSFDKLRMTIGENTAGTFGGLAPARPTNDRRAGGKDERDEGDGRTNGPRLATAATTEDGAYRKLIFLLDAAVRWWYRCGGCLT